jgi:uncharacterized protein
MRLFILLAGLLGILIPPALAQIAFPPAKPVNTIVTVLSDELSEPASPATKILNELSIAFDKQGNVRLLSMNGYGGPVNVRDLLQLRGADFAILNNDVLAYLDFAAALPEARRKIRLVAPLMQQAVLLFGRQNIKSINDLRGRKIGVPSRRASRGVTAKTLFGLMKIEAEFVELDDNELAKRAGDLDAILLYEKDLPALRALGIAPDSHHLVPIPSAGALSSVYLPAELGKFSATGFVTSGPSETIQVTTVLAAFDWSSKQGRYTDVVSFIEKFFALVPQFRASNPGSNFSGMDVRAGLPGWKRYGTAEALAAAAPPPKVGNDNQASIETGTDAIRVIAVARPPLTNRQDKDGGVALKILTAALGAKGIPVSVQWAGGERALLDALLTSKTADAGLFWQTPACDAPSNQAAIEAELCDRTVLSDPLMQAVVGVFTRLDTPLDPKSPETTQTRTICMPANQPTADEALANTPWIKAASLKTLRPKTLLDCLAAVDARDADALIAIESEARFAIERLKLLASFQISQRPGIATGLHAVVAKDHPRQAQLIQTINEALAKFRSSGGLSAVMAAHLADLTGSTANQPQ